MEIASLCLILYTLNIDPNRVQFFWYESITLTCAAVGNSSGWIFKRNTSSQTCQPSSAGWGTSHGSSCTIQNAYPTDTGVYWCESEQGECSNTINITVTDRDVILQSPVLPVETGDKVTVVCSYKEEGTEKHTSAFSAKFYKDGFFIGTQPEGKMTFSKVSVADEGFYKCEHPTKGESEQSWLAVRVPAEPPPVMRLPRLLCSILLFVLYTLMFIACVDIYRKWAKARARRRASDRPSSES